jgi:hypothetical protein
VFDCDEAKIEKTANDGGIAYDAAVVLIKSTVYGGAAFTSEKFITVTSGNEWSLAVQAHELGHIFGLADEYNYQPGVDYPALVNLPVPSGGNCSMQAPNTAPAYSAIWAAAGASYVAGCQHEGWFRSSANSVMLDLSEWFNPVSVALIRQFFTTF